MRLKKCLSPDWGGILFALVTLIILPQAESYAQRISFRHYTTSDGLPHNVGYDIHQDREGFIWFGMDNGLVRFDGHRFITYNQQDGLLSPYAILLSEDADGKLWISTHRNGIQYFDGKEFHTSDIDFSNVLDPKIFHFQDGNFIIQETGSGYPGREDVIYSGSLKKDSTAFRKTLCFFKDSVLQSIDIQDSSVKNINENVTGLFKKYTTEPINLEIFQVSPTKVSLLSDHGIYESSYPFNPSESHLQELPVRDYYYLMDLDRDGNKWLVGKKGILSLSPENHVRRYNYPIKDLRIEQISVVDQNRVLLLEKNRKDIFVWEPSTGKIRNIRNSLNLVSTISFIDKDQEGNFWMTTMGQGIFCIAGVKTTSFTTEDGLPDGFINQIIEDARGNLYFATMNGIGVFSDDSIKRFLPQVEGEVRCLYVAPDEKVYLNTRKEYYLMNKGKREEVIHLTKYPDFTIVKLRGFCTDENQNLIQQLRRSYSKLSSINYSIGNQETRKPKMVSSALMFDRKHSNLGGNSILVKERNKEVFWENPNRGLYRINEDLSVDFWGKQEGLPMEIINDICLGRNDTIWFAGNKGVFFHTAGGFEVPEFMSSMPEIYAERVLADQQGRIWIATLEGLFLKANGSIRKFNIHSGLIANDINCIYQDSRERIWIGTSGGITMIEPDNLPLEIDPPKVVIDEVRSEEHRLDSIPASVAFDQPLSISYTTISFFAPEEIKFQYKLLEGSEWITTTNRSLDLAEMRPGKYAIHLRAKKADSDWGSVFIHPIEITPPWWQTVWAITLGIILLGILTIGFIFLRIRAFKRKAESRILLNQELAELKMKVLQSQLNPHFIFNALNVIQGFMLENDMEASNLYLERFSRLMRMFLESSKNNIIILAEEIQLLTLFIEMEQLCYEGRFNYKMEVDERLKTDITLVPSMLIQPFVENAIHHGLLKKTGTGMLSISFHLKDKEIQCLITDDGIGREKSRQLKQTFPREHISRGMQIIEEKIASQSLLIESSIRLNISDLYEDDGQSAGTRVEIIFPLRTQAMVI